MEKKELQEQLRKYYKGKASLAEEKTLVHYFTHGKVPDEFAAEKAFFSAFTTETAQHPPAGFTERMSGFIDSMEKGEDTPVKPLRRFPWITAVSGIAATIALLIGSYFIFLYQPQVKDTFTDPDLAYAQTKEALLYVSSSLNRGTKDMSLLTLADQPVKELSKLKVLRTPVDKLKKLNEMDRGWKTISSNEILDRTEQIMNKYLNINNKEK